MNARRLAVVCGALALACGALGEEITIRVQGSTTVTPIFTLATPVVKEQLGFALKIRAEHGSTEAIHSVAAGAVDVAVTTRTLEAADRNDFPERRLTEARFAIQGLVFIVSRDAWESGVHSISKEQARAVYENETKTWKPLGGTDQALKFFNPDRGRGVWEFMALWLYGEARKAPLGLNWETVPGGREARDSVGFTAGTISVASPRWVDNKTVFALAIKDDKGAVIEPTLENMQTQKYPFTRELFLVSGDKPTGNIRKLFNFMLGPDGQALVKKADFIPLQNPKLLE